MAAKAWATGSEKKSVEEIFFQNDAVSLCLLVNRRSKTMRVVDFRAGPSAAKRMFVLSLAHREGVEKLFTVVERDEVGTWVKLGFTKEGNIPGFYKRSDAFLLGCAVPPQDGSRTARQSEMRISLPARKNGPTSIPSLVKTAARIARGPDSAIPDRYLPNSGLPAWADTEAGPTEDDVEEPVDTRAIDFAEKTLMQGKKHAKDLAERVLPPVKLAIVKESDTKKALAAALKGGRAMTAFEPFGRDVQRRYFSLTARGGFELVASTESQSCFGNAFLELLTAPRNDAERFATASALKALCDRLLADGTVSCFSLAPSDDVALAAAFVFNGFRRTGLLQNHLVVGGVRKDAIVFARKLANPADE
jgi:hypothetical protein